MPRTVAGGAAARGPDPLTGAARHHDEVPTLTPTLRLETGPLQHEAIALYERSGYRPIAAFGHYVGEPDEWSRYYEKELG